MDALALAPKNSKVKAKFRERWAAELIALLASLLYLSQSWLYAHTQESILDEGGYLVKGLMVATGQYRLYQDYGFWGVYMPLSFLIPGTVQDWFGPGLRAGRYFALLVSALALLGAYLLARRLAGRWWALVVVLAIALNPALIKMYSTAVSQGLIICMLTWCLFLVMGENRPLWQTTLGGLMSGLIVMTRINMAPVIPLVVLYVFWQHGRKAGWLAALAAALPLLVGHILYWPGILRMWAFWLPASFTPWLDAWRRPMEAVPFWNPQIGPAGSLFAFLQGLRLQPVVIAGVLAAVLLWPGRAAWKSAANFRSAVLLAALFFSLLIVHIWAALANNFCTFCLPGYIAFFAITGPLLVAVTFPAWRRRLPVGYSWIIAALVLLLTTALGYSGFEDIGSNLLAWPVPRGFIGQVSRFRETVPLGAILQNGFSIGPEAGRRLVPALFGLAAGGIILLGAAAWGLLAARRGREAGSWGYRVLIGLVVAAMLLSPTPALGGATLAYDCANDPISSYEAIGEHLAQLIPPGAQIYWKGGYSAVPLLYTPGIGIYPPQIYGDYTYYLGGDPDRLARHGFWNEALARRWVQEADFVLVQERYFKGWLKETLEAGGYDELESSPPLACQEKSRILIFRKLP